MISDKEIIELSSKLRFIAKIEAGKKVDVGSMYIASDDLRLSFTRTFIHKTESRHKTLIFIESTIEEAYAYLELATSNYKTIILENLKMIRPGLDHLTDTYHDDDMYTSKLEALIGVLNKRIKIFEDDLQE